MSANTYEVDLVKDSTLKQTNAVLASMGMGQGTHGLQPKSYDDILSIVRLGLAPLVFSIGDIIEVARETAIQATLGEHTGITAVTVDEDAFVAAMHETGEKEYEFTFDGSAWHLGDDPVILKDYGLTVTGTAAEGDTFLVIETASIINMVVMDFIENGKTTAGNIVLHDKTKKYGMILQSEKLLYNLQFDAAEAFYYAKEELPAGTYHVTLGDNYDTAYGGGKTYQFTLTQAVPAGGQIVWPWAYNSQAANAKISTYANGDSTTAIEPGVTVTEGSEGMDLGTLLIAVQDDSGLNSIHRMRYGTNRWKTSAMRQHLNSTQKAGAVWKSQTNYDRPPSWVANTAGFMHGLDPEFIKICADVELLTALSKAAGDTTSTEASAGTGNEVTVDKFFLPSRPEIYGGGDNNSDKGDAWQYYSVNSDAPGKANNTGADTNRIKVNAAGTPAHWWNRSPYAGGGHYVRCVSPTGAVSGGNAYHSYGVAPACIVA